MTAVFYIFTAQENGYLAVEFVGLKIQIGAFCGVNSENNFNRKKPGSIKKKIILASLSSSSHSQGTKVKHNISTPKKSTSQSVFV